MRTIKKYLFLIVPILLWGSTPAVGKLLVNSSLSGMNIFFFASFIAVITSIILITIQKRIPELKEAAQRDKLPWLILNGILLFFYYFFLYKALFYLSAQEAFFINYLWPIIAVFATVIILKEKFNIWDLVGLLLSLFGVYIIATRGDITSFHFYNLKGVIFALADAAMYGIFTALAKRNKTSSLIKNCYYYFFGWMLSLLLLLGTRSLAISIGPIQIIELLWLGVFPYCLASFSWFKALESFKTAKAANIIYLTPFVSILYIRLLVGERIAIVSLAGLMFIILGILIQNFLTLTKPK